MGWVYELWRCLACGSTNHADSRRCWSCDHERRSNQ